MGEGRTCSEDMTFIFRMDLKAHGRWLRESSMRQLVETWDWVSGLSTKDLTSTLSLWLLGSPPWAPHLMDGQRCHPIRVFFFLFLLRASEATVAFPPKPFFLLLLHAGCFPG